MSQIDCEFLDNVRHKQRRVWLTILLWWIAIIVFVVVITSFTNAPDALIQGVCYGSFLLLYIPAISLYRLKCPHCQRAAGAWPIFRYKFMYCKACGKRIECKRKDVQ
jgi:hypothetical protein